MKKRAYAVMLAVIFLCSCGTVPAEDPAISEEIIEAYEETKAATVIVETEEDVYEGAYLEEDYTPIEEWVEPLEAWPGAIPDEYLADEEYEAPYEEVYDEPVYVEERVSYGDHLTAWGGVYWFGNQKETYYNLPMDGVISIMTAYGYSYDDYWVREDGCKMLGPYIMVAANLEVHPRGSLVETSLGTGLVCDTGAFAVNNPLQVDIAVNW